MNITNLLDTIVEIAKEVKTVRSAMKGDVYAIWNSKEVKYASFVVSVRSVTRNDNARTYNLVLYYGDRMLQNFDNRTAIWDDATNTIQSVLNKLEAYTSCIISDDYEIKLFEQSFSDLLAGGYVELAISVEDELGGCEINDLVLENETLIEQLKEAIRKYTEEDAELAALLQRILFKVNGEVLEIS